MKVILENMSLNMNMLRVYKVKTNCYISLLYFSTFCKFPLPRYKGDIVKVAKMA